eukprot:1189-Heterococcus_DN1.PRE.2
MQFTGYNTRQADMLRRTALRQHHRVEYAAALVQRWYRGCCGRDIAAHERSVYRLRLRAQADARELNRSKVWWTDRLYNIKAYTGPTPGTKRDVLRPHSSFRDSSCCIVHDWCPQQQPLITIDYGPRALRQGVHGWGSYSVTGEWIAAAPGYNPDQHVTRRLYENYKLSNSGMLHDQIRPVYAAAVNERIAKQRLGG